MMMGAGMIGMVAFWIIVIWGAVHIAGRVPPPDTYPRQDSALDLLERRFARGEIDREELEAKRRALLDS